MAARRKRRKLRRPLCRISPPSGSDTAERFVVGRCSLYLERHLQRFKSTDESTLTFLSWILGGHMERVFRPFLREVESQVLEDSSKWMDEHLLGPEEYAERLSQTLRRSPKTVRGRFVRLACEALKERRREVSHRRKSEIEEKLSLFQEMFSLSEQEAELCLFLLIISDWSEPGSFFDAQLSSRRQQGRKYLLTGLAMTDYQLRNILSGTLTRVGILTIGEEGITLEDAYGELLRNPSGTKVHENLYAKLESSRVPLEAHLVPREQTEHVIGLLLEEPRTPVHILLYGAPGTGKTSYACGLAKQVGLPAYEILGEDEHNASARRRAAIIACLNVTASGDGSLIVVDEADNLLNTRSSWWERGETEDKGWLNRLMEQPGVRMIWITNRIDGIEESVLRRFAFSIHFRAFGRRQRARLWESVLRGNRVRSILGPSDVLDLARRYEVSPGAMDMAVKIGTQSTRPRDRDAVLKALTMALEAHLTLLRGGMPFREKDRIERNYSIEGLNIQGNLDAMLHQLDEFDRYLRERNREETLNMNLLFFGPPGTGKSELARYIGSRLDREILCRRASDLLSPWVGLTEQNVAKSFADAESQEAILVIDEADSLIFNRRHALRSWEISQTNEFLAQMERYRGILICTTNLFQNLDEASVRRFNHKIRFGYLEPEGNVLFYERLLASLTTQPMDEEIRALLHHLTDLAPGDFRVVRDRFSFQPQRAVAHEAMVKALKEEARIKALQAGRKKIGFS